MSNPEEVSATDAEGEQMCSGTEGRSAARIKIRQAIEAAKRRVREDLHSRVAARSAKIQRETYHAARKAEGREVRPYRLHPHEPQQPWETRVDHERRMQRDRQRSYRGTLGQFFSERADLSTMSEEERKQHIRDQAANRQRERRQRLREAEAGSRALSEADLTMLDGMLRDLVLD